MPDCIGSKRAHLVKVRFGGLGAAALLFVSGGAIAASADGGPGKLYVGLDAGHSKLDAAGSQQFFGPQAGQQSGHDVGYRFRLGYQFIRYLALEVGYADFGEFAINDVPYLCLPPATACRFNVRSKTSGALIHVVGSWPFAEHWALNGRLGAMYANVSTTEQNPAIASTHRKYSDSNTALAYGAGVSYELNARVTVSVDWVKYDQVGLGPSLGGGAALYDLGSSSLASVGVSYRL